MKQNFLRLLLLFIFVVPVGLLLSSYLPLGKTSITIVTETSTDLETIRTRIVDDLMKPPIKEDEIESLIKTIKNDGSWPGINYKDTSRTGFQHSEHLQHMFELARAYKKKGGKWYQNGEVKRTVSSALDFWIAHDFICENWWWNEMGTPNWMINTLLVLDADLTEKQKIEGARIASRASFKGVGARAGGDFVPIAGMVCKQGLFKRDDEILQNAIKVMTDQIVVTTDRGIKPDLSFHHRVDNVTSIHTYGTNYVSAFAYWTVKTAGTKYQLPDAALKLLIDYYLDGVCKSMAYGMYTDPGAKNRDLSREGDLAPVGTEIPENLLKSSSYRKKELEEIIKIRKGEIRPEATWDRYYWWSSYFAHQRKAYYSSVRMHSSRQKNMEEPYNEEGLKMHHLADGSNFITRTGKEYYDIFPVWDWQKIPGATIVQKPDLPHWKEIAKKGLSQFVGGVSDGEFGAAAFDFKSVHDPLSAHKAWFFFDKEYVCLGNSILSSSEYPVATTLNQCLLNKDVWISAANKQTKLARGQHELKNVSWIVHDSVGYFFPSPAAVHVSNTTATGNWRLITHQSRATDEPVNKDVFSLWLDHGKSPQNASYEYIVVPGVGSSDLVRYANSKSVKILKNAKDVQAVQHTGMNITQIIFYEPGTIDLGNGVHISASSPCLVTTKTSGKNIAKIAVADPTHQLSALQLKTNAIVNGSSSNWKSLKSSDGKSTTIDISLPAGVDAGKSVVLEMK